MKIKKGDIVKIISGNDKSKQGKVLAVFPRAGRIVIEGVNMKKKHVRSKRQGQKGELVRMPSPFPASRAMLVCPKCSMPTRTRRRVNDSGIKIRECGKCGGEV
jgi:large subunit ribosomal protein L24